MALAHADWVVTEAGFGFDLGGEKFFDIKCRGAGLDPAVVVLVATARALKRHGGVKNADLNTSDPEAVQRGLCNLEKHIENVRAFGKEPVVALNRFPSDSEEEIAVVQAACEAQGASFALSEGVTRGGAGATDLARTVIEQAKKDSGPFKPLYALDASIQSKMESVASKMYGADKVIFSPNARKDLRRLKRLGMENLPLCVAKTPMSLSATPTKAGRPEGFEITVEGVIPAAGAGFVIPMLGDILRMPGLSKSPQMERIDLVDGKVEGLR
jgi:formate--tetrahydrofolate ligase